MDSLIKLLKTYRLSTGIAENIQLADGIICAVHTDMRFFVFNAIEPTAAKDVLQEVLRSITASLIKFRGNSEKEFWAWCYKIASRRVDDHIHKKMNERLQFMPFDDLVKNADMREQVLPLSAEDKHDLEYAMGLIRRAKAECYHILWNHFVIGKDIAEIAEEQSITYDNARMKLNRCLDKAQSLVA